MGEGPHLSPDHVLLLDQAARCAERLHHRCLSGIPLTEERDARAKDVAATVSDGILDCSQHIVSILTEPALRSWMDTNDRADLADLSHELQYELTELDHASLGDPFHHLHAFFANVHCDSRMADLLMRATRGSLRNRMPAPPIYQPAQMEKSIAHIRWLIVRDVPEVLSIDAEGFENPWSENVLRQNLLSRHNVGMVAEIEDRVVGFMVYELHLGLIHMVRFAVKESERRRGIGSDMVKKLQCRLHETRRRRLLLPVPDRSLFLNPPFYAKRCLHAVATVPSCGEDDGHLLEHRVGCASAALDLSEILTAQTPSSGSFLSSQEWDPKTLKDHDPYGLWSDGEDEEGEEA